MNQIHQQDNGNSAQPEKVILRAFLFLLPALIYLPTFGGKIALPLGQDTYSDLLITHYPNLLFLRDSITSYQQIPLWSNLINSGAPFAANPLSGLFYLPGWIAIFFPLPAGLSFSIAVHAIWGTWGMYRFLRSENIGETGSMLGALSFGLMPKLAAHFGAGHVSLIYAISWTPWLLSRVKADQHGWQTGLIAGMLFLADPRWSIYAGLLWLSYDLVHRQICALKRARIYLSASLYGFLFSAPLLIPMMEYVRHATRSALTAADMTQGNLPAGQLLGLLVPGTGGNLEWYAYGGGAAAAILIYTVFTPALRKANRFWLVWILASILLALGTFGLEMAWISAVPFLSLIRVPARSLFLTGLVLAALMGRVFYQIKGKLSDKALDKRICFGIFVSGVLLGTGLGYLSDFENLLIIWGCVFFSLSGLAYLILPGKFLIRYGSWIMALIIMIDLVGASLQAYQVRDPSLSQPRPLISYLVDDQDLFRIYSPSYSVPQSIAVLSNLELADGVDPMQIAAYADFMQEASGVERNGYSVTIPPFQTGDPSRDNQGADLDPGLLGLLNVKYVIAEYVIDEPGLDLVGEDGTTHLYLNREVYPRAWIEKLNKVDALRPVEIISVTPNRLSLAADGPGRLVLSEIDYPGWKVFIDGELAALERAHGVLRSVDLPDGEHRIEFRFIPLSVFSGLSLACLGWASLIIIVFRKKI